MKSVSSPSLRRILSALLIAAVASSAGCSWFRGKSGYENSPESRPLEVPPDLDMPASDPAMQVPAVAGVSSPGATTPTAAAGGAFTIADTVEGAWRRVGVALERIDGVSITDRAEVLSVYNVSYDGQAFLVKVAADGDASRISALDAEGKALTTGSAARLLALLRERLS
jgi:uncharacterized lipoprotein